MPVDVTNPYRIGLGRDLRSLRAHAALGDWRIVRFALRRMVRDTRCRSWWGLWQSEAPGVCRFARRGFTAAQAQRRMRRDAAAELAGQRSLYQRYRWWRAGLRRERLPGPGFTVRAYVNDFLPVRCAHHWSVARCRTCLEVVSDHRPHRPRRDELHDHGDEGGPAATTATAADVGDT